MLDFDLAAMYGVETRTLNQAVKRNIERFPDDFMFQLTKGECEILKSQIVISKMPENHVDEKWKSQIATSKPVERRGETILHDQNDINESTRSQLEAISTALAELQADHRQQPKRKPIRFIQPKDDKDKAE